MFRYKKTNPRVETNNYNTAQETANFNSTVPTSQLGSLESTLFPPIYANFGGLFQETMVSLLFVTRECS